MRHAGEHTQSLRAAETHRARWPPFWRSPTNGPVQQRRTLEISSQEGFGQRTSTKGKICSRRTDHERVETTQSKQIHIHLQAVSSTKRLSVTDTTEIACDNAQPFSNRKASAPCLQPRCCLHRPDLRITRNTQSVIHTRTNKIT